MPKPKTTTSRPRRSFLAALAAGIAALPALPALLTRRRTGAASNAPASAVRTHPDAVPRTTGDAQ